MIEGTIVEYTDQRRPLNHYPEKIVSPSHSRPCCFSRMREIGKPQEDTRYVFQYRRCQTCGFTVRFILREIPDVVLADSLRKTLTLAFSRGNGRKS